MARKFLAVLDYSIFDKVQKLQVDVYCRLRVTNF